VPEIDLGEGGWGGVALRGSLLFAGNSGGDQYPPVTGVVNIYRKVDDSQCSVSPCWVEESQLQRPDGKRLSIHVLPSCTIARQTAGHMTVEVQDDDGDVHGEAAAGDRGDGRRTR
jgi:hypothetical protein